MEPYGTTKTYETTIATEIGEFIPEIVLNPGWDRMPCYRGVADANWSIVPALMREKLPATEFPAWLEYEAAMIRKFKQGAAGELDYEPHSEMEWLAVAQFYGLPTRFTSWSQNALAALWYATASTPGETDGAVWRLIPGDANQTIANDFEQVPETPRIYVPQRRTGAMLNQRCCFLSHPLPEFDTAPIPFEEYYQYSEERWHLCEILIPHFAKAGIRERLASMGVDSYSMRPGPEGLAAQIREQAYRHTDAYEWVFES